MPAQLNANPAMPSPDAVRAEAVRKSFAGHQALRGVSVQFAAGGCHALLGPNGSGKTTLLRIIGGVLAPDAGRVQALGYDVVRSRDDYLPKIGYVPQRFCHYDELTVHENLRFIAHMRTVPIPDQVIERALAEFDLTACARARAGSLSGGQRQRLMLAAALLHGPQVLLLDEPTTALDAKSRTALWARLSTLKREGMTVILTTHEAGDAAYCDSCTTMSDGLRADVDAAGAA
jgi:ABC-2 type transport system ATP-binding protein